MGDNKWFAGRWHINRMEKWSTDAINLVGQAFIEFDEDDMGRFRFIAVTGFTDCRYSNRDEQPCVEFSWQGHDERDETCGRGWAKISTDGEMIGHLYIHCGEDSGFTASKV